SISPLVARVAEHYYLPAPAEEITVERRENREQVRWKNPSVAIYQSRVWEPYWAEATKRLTRHPLVDVKWINAASGETVDLGIKDQPQAPNSMKAMRTAMIEETSPIAMIAIGGMKGVLDEAELFGELRPGKPIFALATTGGAAAMLPEDRRFADRVRIADSGAENLVRQFWGRQEDQNAVGRFGEERNREIYIPYALVAQQI